MPALRLALAALTLAALPARAQLPFTVELEELARPNAPALHSAAYAQHAGRWLFVTGRTNGIHGMMAAPDPFPAEYAHGAVVVYDPESDTRWAASLDELPAAMAAPLRSTNAQFWQQGATLYVVGGYGRDAGGTFVTFPTLTAINVPGIVAAVQDGTPLAPHLRRLTDERLAVTGGHLLLHAGRYHLAGGNRFDGAYTPGTNPGQVYTDAIRSFVLTDDGAALALTDYAEDVDPANLHRRDGNVGPVVLPGGEEGFALYGGVFTAANLPYRTPVYVTGAGRTVDAFEAQFGHYTTPVLPLHDARTGAMHTVFFGGMGQFWFDEAAGTIRQDNLVPFIDDVTALTRAADGTTSEVVLPVQMPGLLGSNAQFFLDPARPAWPNEVVRLEQLTARTRVGHIHGGITTAIPHPFWTMGPSEASRRVFAVYVTAAPVSAEEGPGAGALALAAPVPNPVRGAATLTLTVARAQDVRAEAFDAVGRRVAVLHDGPLAPGAHTLTFDASALAPGLYVVRATGAPGTAAQRVAVAR